MIGYGRGKGEEYEDAYINAIENAKKNMIIIKCDPLHTWPQHVHARFNDVRLKIYANKGAHFWGSPTMWMFLKLTGIYHCAFSIIARKPSPYAMVYAYFLCATKNKKVSDLVERTGDKLYTYNLQLSTYSQHSGLL